MTKKTNIYEPTWIENNNRPKSYNHILAYMGLQTIRVRARIYN